MSLEVWLRCLLLVQLYFFVIFIIAPLENLPAASNQVWESELSILEQVKLPVALMRFCIHVDRKTEP